MILMLFLMGKIYSWQQRPYDEAEGGGRDALSCLLDTWSVAPANHSAEAISTPVLQPWHLTGIITCRGAEADNGCVGAWVIFAFQRR